MKGDFSRDTFDRLKRYSGVLMQQGRVQLDADWNEQLSIQLNRTHVEAIDVIGQSGSPRAGGGFRVEALGAGAGRDLRLTAGRIYVGGLLCELEDESPVPAEPVANQPGRLRVDSMSADGGAFRAGRWVEITASAGPLLRRITSVEADERTLVLGENLPAFGAGERLSVRVVTTYTAQPDNPAPSHTTSPPETENELRLDAPAGLYLAYLHAWQRHVTALDDAQLREKALGGPDTATRIKNVWQVNLLRVTAQGPQPDCQTTFPEWEQLNATATGLLNARARPVEDDEDPCTLPPQAGYRRVENQLYRVEVHRGGPRAEATFKWSRENGSVQTKIETINDDTLTVSDLGRDALLGFASGQWVEVADEESELGPGDSQVPPRPLLRIEGTPDATRREVVLSGSVAGLADRPGLKLRRWDQRGDALEGGVAMTIADGAADAPAWVGLEGGVEVNFSEGTYRAGDYWLIPARTATADIEWPPFDSPGAARLPQAPRGVRHNYCRLALVRVAANAFNVTDCRDIFPPLTAITAADVSYDNRNCLPDLESASTVQQAIDELCRNGRSSCTFVAAPGPGWERVFERIAAGADAQVCFPVGDYPVGRTVRVSGKGHLKLSGCGPGTRILAPDAECAVAFENCRSVNVRNIYAETGSIDSPPRRLDRGLNGTLTFVNCGAVGVEHVALKCGAGSLRSSACVTVRGGAGARSTARVLRCEMSVGHRQQGILLVDVVRAEIEDNVVRVYEKPERLRIPIRVTDARQRADLRHTLITSASLTETPPARGGTNLTFRPAREGGPVVHFRAPTALRAEWNRVLRASPPAATVRTSRTLLSHVRILADRILTDEGFRNQFPRFRALFERLRQQDRAVASQGITVAGRVAEEVRILNNTIEGVLQGVHVGLSRTVRTEPGNRPVRSQHDLAGEVTVAGNSIAVILPPDAGRIDRHGIFVGNCHSLRIENNNVSLQRLEDAGRIEVEGIRVWGVLGDRVSVSRNHLSRAGANRRSLFDTGIRITPHPAPNRPVPTGPVGWFALENVVACVRDPPVVAPTNVIKRDNFRVN